ncbi:HAD-IC family P-type ATPase [Saccharothrix algeriensis]|uniref:Cation-transporting ATPase F n=1 Tax=Saccharothrix algeriensis TaxID=173560 RepID=A0A8T8HZQ4_9PSEU|nr:HAD-IC family P-type ATPase [Saccharothrix algeriensis]MBM7809725.1 cation-transporting ATPase F [Saccharothrix algeriensis]QTR04012.1 HAD-IC family P-type ATPase [Saccharothrix algeriensis]
MPSATAERAAAPHGLPAPEVVLLAETDAGAGLTGAVAARRLAALGPNALPERRGPGRLRRFLGQFHHPLIYVLLGAGALTFALGEVVDASVVLAVVLVNAVVGHLQEVRAERALDALVAMVRTTATVVRDGAVTRVESERLVPGDLVLLEEGDQVPADLRLVGVRELRVDESALTGESQPVAKDPLPVPHDTALADRTNMAYSGTLITSGGGRGVVVSTGADTEIGRVHRLVGATEAVQTPLTRKLARFSLLLTWVILGLAVLSVAVGVLRGEPFADMVTAAVALAVGAIPEGLPAAVTVTLAIGVARMARRNAVIRRLPAVETLGSTTVICTDKTGTLTANAMTVREVVAGVTNWRVGGVGYAPHGDVPPVPDAVREVLLAGLACNDADVVERDGRWAPIGDPTEAALVVAARKAGVTGVPERVDELPFTSQRRFMATRHTGGVVYLKGAVERIAEFTGAVDHAEADRLAAQGLRVLAFARAHLPLDVELTEEALRGRAVFLGLQAMHDPPRPEALDAVRACRDAGIEVRMITGDHRATARAIADHFDLAEDAVHARVSPEEKLRLVKELQARGQVVAMTGDGVNDAPALRRADIGVAMGRGGTEVAKQAADMVLTDDDFSTIRAAVEEGRAVFDNLRKFIIWTLPTNMAEGLVILTAIMAGTTLPILPVQILWINMTTAVALGLTLAFEPREPDVMRRPPLPPSLPLLTGALVQRILLVSVVLLAGSFTAFHLSGGAVDEARTVAVNVFVAAQIAYLVNSRSLERFRPHVGLRANPWLPAGIAVTIALQLLFTYAPFMNTLFHTAPIGWASWAFVAALALVAYGVVELDKWWRRR